MSNPNYSLEIVQQTRKNCLNILDTFSIEEINHIPKGFNNNLAWNFGHIIVTQQLLCYGLSGLTPIISKEMISQYRKGTRPGEFVSPEELEKFKTLANTCIDRTIQDLDSGIFKEYKEYPTSYGMTLHNIQEAITFNASHEALHFGTMISLKNALNLVKQ